MRRSHQATVGTAGGLGLEGKRVLLTVGRMDCCVSGTRAMTA